MGAGGCTPHPRSQGKERVECEGDTAFHFMQVCAGRGHGRWVVWCGGHLTLAVGTNLTTTGHSNNNKKPAHSTSIHTA